MPSLGSKLFKTSFYETPIFQSIITPAKCFFCGWVGSHCGFAVSETSWEIGGGFFVF